MKNKTDRDLFLIIVFGTVRGLPVPEKQIPAAQEFLRRHPKVTDDMKEWGIKAHEIAQNLLGV